MADWFFTVTGDRDKVDIELVTPLDNVFTKPLLIPISELPFFWPVAGIL